MVSRAAPATHVYLVCRMLVVDPTASFSSSVARSLRNDVSHTSQRIGCPLIVRGLRVLGQMEYARVVAYEVLVGVLPRRMMRMVIFLERTYTS
jgi:hypothetical protein